MRKRGKGVKRRKCKRTGTNKDRVKPLVRERDEKKLGKVEGTSWQSAS